jgi:hypothetical protein
MTGSAKEKTVFKHGLSASGPVLVWYSTLMMMCQKTNNVPDVL